MQGFACLPPEIRTEIVKQVLDHWVVGGDSEAVAPYATVCREWQSIIERYTFSNLKISLRRIPQFAQLVTHNRRRCLRRIHLHVELPEYLNDPCEERETWVDKVENNRLFTSTLGDLFACLHEWDEDEVADEGIHLYLSMSSESDLRNTSLELWQRRRWNLKDIGERRFAESNVDFLGQDEESQRHCALKPVYVITSFETCQLIRRSIVPAAYSDIIAKLPRVRKVVLEILKDRLLTVRRAFFNQFGDMLAHWPRSLECIEITTNTSCSWRQLPHDTVSEADTGLVLCQQLRQFATQLKVLRISNVVRVREFLKPVWPHSHQEDKEAFLKDPKIPFYPQLEVLHLSYGAIYYKREWYKDVSDINEHEETVKFRQSISLAAARLAQRMPRIREMTIVQRPMMWAGKHGLAYVVSETETRLTWTSTFDFQPWPRTLEAWTEVCSSHTKNKLKVDIRTLCDWRTDGSRPLAPAPPF